MRRGSTLKLSTVSSHERTSAWFAPRFSSEFFVRGKPLTQFGPEQLRALVKSETRLAYRE
jgi:hypothetical protein